MWQKDGNTVFEADNKASLDKDEQSDNDEQWSLDNRALIKASLDKDEQKLSCAKNV